MATTYESDGETWEVYLSHEHPQHGVRALVFTCVTNSSYGWRVVEVPAADFPSNERVEGLSRPDLHALYDRSEPFDYPHDPRAKQKHVGQPGERSPHHGV